MVSRYFLDNDRLGKTNKAAKYQPASPSQYTAFGQCVLLQRAISGAFLAQMKSSAYEDLCVRALPNALVAVSD